jgi:hypothetical protein
MASGTGLNGDRWGEQRPESAATLASLCSELGHELLEVVVAPAGLDVAIADVGLHDPLDPPGTGLVAGELALAVGARADDDATLALMSLAGSAGAGGVVVKRRDDDITRLVAAAHDAGVALLATGPDVPWGDLYRLLHAWLAVDRAGDLPSFPPSATGDLFALADATAAATGGPVTIEDLQGRVLAFSQDGQDVDQPRKDTVLGRRVPERWMREVRRQRVIERLLRSDDVIPVEVEDVEPRRVIAVRAGATVVGAIWLVGRGGSLSNRADEALREAAQIAALHLMRRRVFDDLERRVRRGTLRMLLRGEAPPRPLLDRLDLPVDGDLLTVAIDAGGDTSTDERLVDLVLEHLHAYRWQAAATALDGRVYVLVAPERDEQTATLQRMMEDCLVRLRQTLNVRLRAAIGAPAATAEQVADARHSSDRCLDLGPEQADLVTLEDVHGRVVVAQVGTFLADLGIALSGELKCLIDHDQDHGTEYVATLRAFLDGLGDPARAAPLLHVHVNTVRYRMRRIVEMTGLDLLDPDTRLAVELELRTLPQPGS